MTYAKKRNKTKHLHNTEMHKSDSCCYTATCYFLPLKGKKNLRKLTWPKRLKKPTLRNSPVCQLVIIPVADT